VKEFTGRPEIYERLYGEHGGESRNREEPEPGARIPPQQWNESREWEGCDEKDRRFLDEVCGTHEEPGGEG
jgi:hypothetical protein